MELIFRQFIQAVSIAMSYTKNYLHVVASRYRTVVSILLFSLLLFGCSDQHADFDFDTTVKQPACNASHPKVLFDEAHNNIHKSDGTYKPFVDLIKNDGYTVAPAKSKIEPGTLKEFDIFIISNAKGEKNKYDPAFTENECNTIQQWVQGGGCLLLIADHYPLGSAVENLSKRFGVDMSKGFTNDPIYFDSTSYTNSRLDGKSQLVFSRTNGLLLSHPITEGRNPSEYINRIITFTGQSLKGPEGSMSLLALSDSATDQAPDSIWEAKEWIFFSNTITRFSEPRSAAGRSQAIALEFGKGRVVVLGEAAMLTAQVAKKEKFGMNVPGIDNRQFALNIMHWLSHLL